MEKTYRAIGCLMVLAAVSSVRAVGQGQSQNAPGIVKLLDRNRIPLHAKAYMAAVGDRLLKPGAERVVQTGRMEHAGQIETMTWTWEFPGKLVMQRNGKNPVVFNPGKTARPNLDDLEDELLEMLTADTTEHLLNTIHSGVSTRFLGSAFRVRGVSGFGETVDIIAMAAPVPSRSQGGGSVKHYMFDSKTRLLHKVAYEKIVADKQTRVVIEYSGYENVNGQMTPKRIVRYNGAQKRFQIDVQTAQWQAAQNDGKFDGPK